MLSKLKICEAQQMLGPKVPANALVHLKPVAAPVQEKACAAMRDPLSIIIRDSECRPNQALSKSNIELGEEKPFIQGPCLWSLVPCYTSTFVCPCVPKDSCLPVWTSKGLEFQSPCGKIQRHKKVPGLCGTGWELVLSFNFSPTILILLLMIIMVHDHNDPHRKWQI